MKGEGAMGDSEIKAERQVEDKIEEAIEPVGREP